MSSTATPVNMNSRGFCLPGTKHVTEDFIRNVDRPSGGIDGIADNLLVETYVVTAMKTVGSSQPGEADVLPCGGVGEQVAGRALEHRAHAPGADPDMIVNRSGTTADISAN